MLSGGNKTENETETGQISVIRCPNTETEAETETEAVAENRRGEERNRSCREMNPWELAEIQNPKSNGTQQYNATN